MQVFTARVRGARIVVDEGIELAEGTLVTVIAGEADAPFELNAADEDELAESIAKRAAVRSSRPMSCSADPLAEARNRAQRASSPLQTK